MSTIAVVSLVVAAASAVVIFARAGDFFGEAKEDFWARMGRWLLLTVVAALAPLGVDYINAISDAGGSFPRLSVAYEHGELCLVTTALAGVALGELLGLSEQAKVAKVCLGGLCVIAVFVGAALYVTMKARFNPQSAPMMAYISGWTFLATLFVSTCSVGLSELKK